MRQLSSITQAARALGLPGGVLLRSLPQAPPGVVILVGDVTRIDIDALRAWFARFNEPRAAEPQAKGGGA